MSEILPPDQYDYLLQQLGVANQEGNELDTVAFDVMKKFGWEEHHWGQAVQSLIDQGLINGFTQPNGSGNYVLAVPTEITVSGWKRIERLRDESEPG